MKLSVTETKPTETTYTLTMEGLTFDDLDYLVMIVHHCRLRLEEKLGEKPMSNYKEKILKMAQNLQNFLEEYMEELEEC